MKMFRAMTLTKVAGISYRQAQYWDKTELLKATVLEGKRQKVYSLADLALGFLISTLRQSKNSIQQIRVLIDPLRPFLTEDRLPTMKVLFLPPEAFIVAQHEVTWMTVEKREVLRVDGVLWMGMGDKKPIVIDVGAAVKPLYDLANSAEATLLLQS